MQNLSFSFLSILLITLFIISLFTFYFILNSSKLTKKHGFKTYPYFGTQLEFLLNRHRFLDWLTEVLAAHPTHTSVFFQPGRAHGIFTAYPANVEHILKSNFGNYPKGARFSSFLHDFLGLGIFNVDDNLWRHQRKTASFEFNKRSLKTFVLDSVNNEITTRLVPLLKRVSVSSRVVDMQDLLERFAFDNVCKLAFNVDPSCLAGDGSAESEFMRAFEEAALLSSGRFMYALPMLWMVKKKFKLGSEKRLRDSIKTVHGFADNVIRVRLEELKCGDESNKKNQDLLSRFIETSLSQDCTFLRDIVISFILAGRDTTSSGLSWFFWLLSHNPDVVKRIRSEVSEVRTRAGKQVGDTYDFDELKKMNYLHGAISETLRLYPPVPIDTRACLKDDTLPDGTKIKKDWFISYDIHAMGRMESIWGKDCMEFRPERWLDESGLYKSDNPFSFPVFNAGPRICLGKEMAYIQMKSIVACVVEQFEVDVLKNEKCPQILLSLTLRMKNGLPIKVREIKH